MIQGDIRKTCGEVFAIRGIPRRIETANGPTFNSSRTSPRKWGSETTKYNHSGSGEDGEEESLIKLLNKIKQIALTQGQKTRKQSGRC